jgi:arsenical pump membrane protein
MDLGLAGAAPGSWSIWVIAALATAGVILRPFAWPEWIWAVAGAALLDVLGLLPLAETWRWVAKGTNVYLFLIGMMLLSEAARHEGLFDHVAARAARAARGSASRLFSLVFAVGAVVTVFLSNDATAVVLTPAVSAMARVAKAKDTLPYLFICAFIANAASFVLPISNPANLVIYGSHMPPLLDWLGRFTLPSALSIGATFAVLRWTQRASLRDPIASDAVVPVLSLPGRLAAWGIAATALVLLTASALDTELGLPTCLAGLATTLAVMAFSSNGRLAIVRSVSWGVLPLVAGLFVLVGALEKTGVTADLAALLRGVAQESVPRAAWVAGLVMGFGTNLVNNLPAGLVAGRVVELAQAPDQVRSALLIAVDVGPNLSVTGSLATILWLTALRRDGHQVGAWRFLKLGALVMPPALLLSLGWVLAFG